MKRSAALMTLAAVVLLAACSPNKSQPPKPKENKPAPWNMSLQTRPDKPQMNQGVTFLLEMSDRTGKPVSGAQVNGSLVMPLMDMGKKEFKFSEKGAGRYEGSGKMDMAGPWEVVVTAKVAGVEGQKTFDVSARE